MNAPITIASFRDDTIAHIYLALLGHNDIQAVIQDGNTVNANWFYTIAVAGVKLQVRRKDIFTAIEILNSQPNLDDDTIDIIDTEKWLCPQCKSSDIEYEKLSRKLAFLTILLLRFPLPFINRIYHCWECGHKWKEIK